MLETVKAVTTIYEIFILAITAFYPIVRISSKDNDINITYKKFFLISSLMFVVITIMLVKM